MHHSIEEGRPLEDHSEEEELSPEDSATEANHTPQTPDLEPVLYAEKKGHRANDCHERACFSCGETTHTSHD